jgi:ribosomal protein S18 acetylase RimI-like enzyme
VNPFIKKLLFVAILNCVPNFWVWAAMKESVSKDSILLEKATLDDLDGIIDVYRDAIAKTFDPIGESAAEDECDFVKTFYSTSMQIDFVTIIIARDQISRNIVGYISFWPEFDTDNAPQEIKNLCKSTQPLFERLEDKPAHFTEQDKALIQEMKACFLEFPEYGVIEIDQLMVHSSVQKSGLGKKLIAAMCDFSPLARAAHYYELGVMEKNTKAVGFYEHLGFMKTEKVAKGFIMRTLAPYWLPRTISALQNFSIKVTDEETHQES